MFNRIELVIFSAFFAYCECTSALNETNASLVGSGTSIGSMLYVAYKEHQVLKKVDDFLKFPEGYILKKGNFRSRYLEECCVLSQSLKKLEEAHDSAIKGAVRGVFGGVIAKAGTFFSGNEKFSFLATASTIGISSVEPIFSLYTAISNLEREIPHKKALFYYPENSNFSLEIFDILAPGAYN